MTFVFLRQNMNQLVTVWRQWRNPFSCTVPLNANALIMENFLVPLSIYRTPFDPLHPTSSKSALFPPWLHIFWTAYIRVDTSPSLSTVNVYKMLRILLLLTNRHRSHCVRTWHVQVSSRIKFIIWLALQVGKMNQILRCDWLSKQVRCSILPARDYLLCPAGKISSKAITKSFIDQACSVKMAGYWPRSFFVWLWTSTPSGSIDMQKKNLANVQPFWLHTWSITRISGLKRNSEFSFLETLSIPQGEAKGNIYSQGETKFIALTQKYKQPRHNLLDTS